MHRRRQTLAPALALLTGVALAAGCRAREEPAPADPERPGALAVIDAAGDDVPASAPIPILGGDEASLGALSADRLARIDARLLDLQAAINQLEADEAERIDCESRWEELDGRRAALRREAQSLGADVMPADRDERRRTLAEDLDDLETDLEAAIQEVESRLSRG